MPRNLKNLIGERMGRTGESYQTAHRHVTRGTRKARNAPRMSGKASPAAHGHELWRITDAEAVALVDEHLGPASDWEASPLMPP